MLDDRDYHDGSVPRTLPESFDWSPQRRRGRRGPPRRFPWALLVVLLLVAVGIVLWFENRTQVRISFFSVHVTAPLWVVAVANLVLGLILGGALVSRSRR